MTRPKGIDLFCGAGGMSLGFEQAGFDVVAAVEIDPIHAAVHKYNFPENLTICEDITKLTGEQILDMAGVKKGEIDVVFGGPPCQGFSLIGKRLIDDPRNSLVGHFARIVCEIQPRYFVMENVSGLTIGGAKEVLHQFIHEFEDTDYEILLPYQVLNASNYGVPQDRKRLFVIGYRKDMPAPQYPEAKTAKRGKKGIEGMQQTMLPWCPSVSDAIGDLPNIDGFDALSSTDSIHYPLSPSSSYAQKLHGIAQDPEDFSHPRDWEPNLLTNSLRTEHTDRSKERFANTKGGETESVSRFLRLHTDGVCNTLRAGTDSKRGAHTSPRPIHPVYNRVISVREAARIHSFPDWFRLHVTKWHGFREIGNAVPPMLARAVASELVKAMGITPVKPTTKISSGDEALLRMDMTAAAEHFNVARDVIGTRDRKPSKELQEA